MPLNSINRRRLVRFILYFKRFSAQDGIVIFSEPRGGSTWLMQLMGKLPKMIINWEPFHPEFGVLPKGHSWGKCPFVPKEATDHVLRQLLEDIFTLRRLNLWTLSFARRAFFVRIVITKFVRANALIPWILSNFSFVRKPILLIRHPIATCKSQQIVFDNYNHWSKNLKPEDWIHSPITEKHLTFYLAQKSDLERKIVIWCIHNVDTLNTLEVQEQCLWVFYEDLVVSPMTEMRRILNSLKLSYSDSFLENLKYRKRSKSDFKRVFLSEPEAQLAKTLDGLDNEMIERIQAIFDYFDFKLYSAQDNFPQKSAYPHLQND